MERSVTIAQRSLTTKTFNSASGSPSPPPKNNTDLLSKVAGGLDEHLKQGRSGMMDRSDPSLHTAATMDVSNSSANETESMHNGSSHEGSYDSCVRVSLVVEEGDSEQGDDDEVYNYNPDGVLDSQEETVDFASTSPSKCKEESTPGPGLSSLLPTPEMGEPEQDSLHSLHDVEKGYSAGVVPTATSTTRPRIIDVDQLIASRNPPKDPKLECAMAARVEAMKSLPPLKTYDLPQAALSPTSSILGSGRSLQSIEEDNTFADPMTSLPCVQINEEDFENDWSGDTFVVGASGSQPSTDGYKGSNNDVKQCPREDFGKSKTRPMMSARAMPMSLRSLSSFSFKSLGKSMSSLVSGASSQDSGHGHGHLSHKDYALIEETLKKNFMFKNLSNSALHSLVVAFERTEAFRDDIIIHQGDTCENGYVYVIAEGLCSVVVDGVVVPGPYGTLARKSIFGELGVLYNSKRGATISVKSGRAILFRATCDAFTKSVNFVPPNRDNAVAPAEEDLHEIDDAINQLTGTKQQFHNGEIIRQYKPGRFWLWSQWHGTILQHNISTALCAMLLSLLLVVVVRVFGEPTWSLGLAPDEEHPWIKHLSMVQKLWVYQMTLTTFVLTFFVNQAYSFWQDIIATTRLVQGRINDFMLLIATSAERNKEGTFTPEAVAVMDDVGSAGRLFHALFWASTARRFKSLATPAGLERMAQRGMMTQRQLKVLESNNTDDNQNYNACLEWMMVRALQGIEEDVLHHSDALSRQLMHQMCQMRANTASVIDNGKHRMPLAYTHFIQILVDTFVVISPFALYPDLGVYSILCVGIMTLFYTGLLDLAKIFLDPFDNQNFTKTSANMGVDLGVLTRETNASSVHFKESGVSMPFAKKVAAF